ncbi:MAG: hypothetical protein ACYTGZ_07125 [Planctomycetota bacterium]
MITWNSRTLYEKPTTGVCAITGEYETGRFYLKDGVKRVFVGNTIAPAHVEKYVEFLTAVGTVDAFKRGYSRTDRVAARVEMPKKAKAKK